MQGELEPVVAGAIWAHQRPVWFHGVRLRARTTVVKLEDGGLLVHSPAPPSDALREELDALGPVRWLVVPNKFHHLGTPGAAAAWPDARAVGPASAAAKSSALRFHHDITEAWAPPELDVLPLDGVPFLDETVLFHRPTGSLLGADVVMSCCAKDHWTWRLAGRVFGVWDRVRTPPDVKWKTTANDAAARAVDAMCALPLERVLVAHADPIEDRPAEQLAEAWTFVRA